MWKSYSSLERNHKSLSLITFPEEGPIQVGTFLFGKFAQEQKEMEKTQANQATIKNQHWSFCYTWFSPSDCGTMVGIETTLPPFVLITDQFNRKDWTVYIFLFSCGLKHTLRPYSEDPQGPCVLILLALFCTILFRTSVHFLPSAAAGSVVSS